MEAEDYEYYDVGVPLLQMNDALQNGKFQKIITVAKTTPNDGIRANYRTSDYDSDAECIQTVFNNAEDGCTILIFEGTYSLTTRISQTSKNLNIIGMGKVIFNLSGGGADTPVIQFSGSLVISTTISADSSGNTVTLTSSTGVQTGDLLKIYNDDLWCPNDEDYPQQKTGEMYQISSISESTVTLTQNLLRSYLASNSHVEIFRPIRVNIENIKFVGTGSTDNVVGIRLNYCANSNINNCELVNHGRRSLLLMTCYDVKVTENHIANSCYPGSGYGIFAGDSSALITIAHNTIENCRHCISSGTADFKALNRDILIDGNTLIGATVPDSNVIDAHQMAINYTVVNNKIYPKHLTVSPYTGFYAFSDGTQKSIFSNNYIEGGGAVIGRGAISNGNYIISQNILKDTYGGALYVKGRRSGYSMSITENQVENCTHQAGTYGIIVDINTETYSELTITDNIFDTCSLDAISVIQPSTLSGAQLKISDNTIKNALKNAIVIETFNQLSITDNIIDTCSKNAISIIQQPVDTNSNLLLSDNTITNVQEHGMTIRRVDPTDIIRMKICDNIITDVNKAAGYFNGIYLIDVDGCTCTDNTIENCYVCIRENTLLETSAVDNNIIIGNKVSGNTYTTPIIKTGVNTKIEGNAGYKTENTGTAIIVASGTSVVVNHGLAVAPTRVVVTPGSNINCWVTPASITATQFTISSTAPVADTTVFWSVKAV